MAPAKGGQQGGQGGPRGPQRNAGSTRVPERFGAQEKSAEAALQKAAQAAVAQVAKAGKKPETVMEALADFHDAWVELDAFEAEEAVQGFFLKLADDSGADLEPMDAWEEVHQGLYGMEGIGTEQLLDTVAELLDVPPADAEEQLAAFADEVVDGLMRNARSFVQGFGTFTAEDLAEVEEPGPYDVQIGLQLDKGFEARLLKAAAGQESEDEPEMEGPYGGVLEALLEAFLNDWAVDIEGLGTLACPVEDGVPLPVFKPAVEFREELLEGATEEAEEPPPPTD